jgi:hypothetical protein
MKLAFLLMYAGAALAHPGHGQPELLHGHGEWLLIVIAIAAFIGWKVLRKP